MPLNSGLTTSDLALWLRVDEDEAEVEESILQLILDSAEQTIEQELGHSFEEEEDIPDPIRKAILKLATSDYERRQAGLLFETLSVHQSNYGDALAEVRKDLWPYRRLVGF